MALIKAAKSQKPLKALIQGISGCGKTLTALYIAKQLSKKGIAVLDSEHRTSTMFADEVDFFVEHIDSYSPKNYVEKIHEIERNKDIDFLNIDSLSHSWFGTDGALEQVNKIARASQSHNTFTPWNEVSPMVTELLETIIASPLPIIVTLRKKSDWVIEKNEQGKNVPKKLGMKPIFKEDTDFEFDLVADMDSEHNFTVIKSRIRPLDGYFENKPDGKKIVEIYNKWRENDAPYVHELPKSSVHGQPQPQITDETALDESRQQKLFGQLNEILILKNREPYKDIQEVYEHCIKMGICKTGLTFNIGHAKEIKKFTNELENKPQKKENK